MKIDNVEYKIDLKKWKNTVSALLNDRADRLTFSKDVVAGTKTWNEYHAKFKGYPQYEEELTMLYSIRAHIRGKIHRKVAKLTDYEWHKLRGKKTDKPSTEDSVERMRMIKLFVENNGKIKFDLTLEDQAVYIGDKWKKYVIKKEVMADNPEFFNNLSRTEEQPTFGYAMATENDEGMISKIITAIKNKLTY